MSQVSPWLGKYRITGLIACGGMADVHGAVMTGPYGFRKTVALKLMHPQISRDPMFVNMFIGEAKICAGLVHPNIVQIIDFGEIDGTLYIAMEYVHGISLAEFVRTLVGRNEHPKIDVSLYIIGEVLNALHYTASFGSSGNRDAGIVHRDITPHNILLSADGDVKLTDFGIAKARGSVTTTAAGTLKGKLRYMSPEQARGEALDTRSDLYSLALILYELITHRQAYTGDTDMTLLRQVQASNIDARPSRINPDIHQELEAIVVRALSAMPGDRFQTPESFRQAISVLITDPAGARMRLAGHVRDMLDKRQQNQWRTGGYSVPEQVNCRSEKRSSRFMTAAYRAGRAIVLLFIILLFPDAHRPTIPQTTRVPVRSPAMPAQVQPVSDTGHRNRVAVASKAPAHSGTAPQQLSTTASSGVLVINALPWARVSIADAASERFAGITPIRGYSVQPGTYTMVFRNKAYGTRRVRIAVSAGEKKIVVLHTDPLTGAVSTTVRSSHTKP